VYYEWKRSLHNATWTNPALPLHPYSPHPLPAWSPNIVTRSNPQWIPYKDRKFPRTVPEVFDFLTTNKSETGTAAFSRATECVKKYAALGSQQPSDILIATSDSIQYTHTRIYETIQKVGRGTITTAQDGIPRFSFYVSPTTETTKFITVTAVIPGSRIIVERLYPPEKTDADYGKPICPDAKSHMKPMEISTDNSWASTRNCAQMHRWRGNWEPDCFYYENQEFCDAVWQAWMGVVEMDNSDFAEEALIDKPGWMGMGFCKRSLTCELKMGPEVALIYWPQVSLTNQSTFNNNTTSNSTLSALPTITVDAITFKGQDLYLRSIITATDCTQVDEINGDLTTYSDTIPYQTGYVTSSILTGPFTFKYPTVYLAHHPISVAFNRVVDTTMHEGRESPIFIKKEPRFTRSAGIIALNAGDVYSMRPKGADLRWGTKDGLDYAQAVAQGKYTQYTDTPARSWYKPGELRGWELNPLIYERVHFDFANLQDPVPASVYYDARAEDCWGLQSHCDTITDDTYRPRLALKNKVWRSLLPDAFDCTRPLLVDPAIALYPLTTTQAPPTIRAETSRGTPKETTFSDSKNDRLAAQPGDSAGHASYAASKPTPRGGARPPSWNNFVGPLPKFPSAGDHGEDGRQPKTTPGPQLQEQGRPRAAGGDRTERKNGHGPPKPRPRLAGPKDESSGDARGVFGEQHQGENGHGPNSRGKNGQSGVESESLQGPGKEGHPSFVDSTSPERGQNSKYPHAVQSVGGREHHNQGMDASRADSNGKVDNQNRHGGDMNFESTTRDPSSDMTEQEKRKGKKGSAVAGNILSTGILWAGFGFVLVSICM
jgi:hypothetical protein